MFRIKTKKPKCPKLKPAEKVDLDKYIGKWYEIARTRNPFEQFCGDGDDGPVAFYRKTKGVLQITNSCNDADSGKKMTAKGIGINLDQTNNSRFLVFMSPIAKVLHKTLLKPFKSFLRGNYWILHVECPEKKKEKGIMKKKKKEKKKKYCIAYVGSPDRKFLWLSDEKYDEFVKFADKNCFDTAEILRVRGGE